MANENKHESAYMNEVLDRLGLQDVRAVPGTQASPTFSRAFHAMLDRIEALDARVRALERGNGAEYLP